MNTDDSDPPGGPTADTRPAACGSTLQGDARTPPVQPPPAAPRTTSALSPSGVLSAPPLLPLSLSRLQEGPQTAVAFSSLLEIREGKQGEEKPGAGKGKAQQREKYIISQKLSCRISFPW